MRRDVFVLGWKSIRAREEGKFTAILTSDAPTPLYQECLEYAHAMSSQAPPTALILFWAIIENSLALTTHGTFGSSPFPRTLKKP